VTTYRQNDRQTPPRTNARPRRTLLGRLRRGWLDQRRAWRERPLFAVFCWFVLAPLAYLGAAWLHTYYPRVMRVLGWAPLTLFLVMHWLKNRGAE
jgi:hypothetical protein